MTDETGPVAPQPKPEVTEVTVVVAGRDFARRQLRARIKRLRPFLYAALALVLAVTLTWLVFFSSVLTVRSVKVTGNGTIGAGRIERAAQVPMDEQLIHVDLAAIQARVESIPAVESAAVSRSWPHAITIHVTPRVPIAIVDRGTGLQAVDEHGVLFGTYAHAPADLPVLRTEPNVTAAALAQAAEVVVSLPEAIAGRVDHVDAESVDQITLHLSGAITVVWGSAQDSASKAEVLGALLAHVTKKNPVSTIDVSVPGRPTTR
ncbi:MAG: cell division protein FtsQ/DivIB [Marmoricola sp.]